MLLRYLTSDFAVMSSEHTSLLHWNMQHELDFDKDSLAKLILKIIKFFSHLKAPQVRFDRWSSQLHDLPLSSFGAKLLWYISYNNCKSQVKCKYNPKTD